MGNSEPFFVLPHERESKRRTCLRIRATHTGSRSGFSKTVVVYKLPENLEGVTNIRFTCKIIMLLHNQIIQSVKATLFFSWVALMVSSGSSAVFVMRGAPGAFFQLITRAATSDISQLHPRTPPPAVRPKTPPLAEM